MYKLTIDFQWKKKDFKETDPPNLMISTDICQSFVPLKKRLYETFPKVFVLFCTNHVMLPFLACILNTCVVDKEAIMSSPYVYIQASLHQTQHISVCKSKKVTRNHCFNMYQFLQKHSVFLNPCCYCAICDSV